MFDFNRSFQSLALMRALAVSYGVSASLSQARRARALAASVRAIHPAIYQVGACQVNLWHLSCTCKSARSRTLAGRPWGPCVHVLALYLAGEWSPSHDQAAYLASVGVEEPAPVATYCHIRGRRGAYRVTGTYRQLPACPPWVEIADQSGQPQAPARMGEIHRLTTIYEV